MLMHNFSKNRGGGISSSVFHVFQPPDTFLLLFPVFLSSYSVSVIFIHIAVRFVFMHFTAFQSKES